VVCHKPFQFDSYNDSVHEDYMDEYIFLSHKLPVGWNLETSTQHEKKSIFAPLFPSRNVTVTALNKVLKHSNLENDAKKTASYEEWVVASIEDIPAMENNCMYDSMMPETLSSLDTPGTPDTNVEGLLRFHSLLNGDTDLKGLETSLRPVTHPSKESLKEAKKKQNEIKITTFSQIKKFLGNHFWKKAEKPVSIRSHIGDKLFSPECSPLDIKRKVDSILDGIGREDSNEDGSDSEEMFSKTHHYSSKKSFDSYLSSKSIASKLNCNCVSLESHCEERERQLYDYVASYNNKAADDPIQVSRIHLNATNPYRRRECLQL